VRRLNEAIRGAVDSNRFKAGAANLSVEAMSLGTSDFAQLIKSDLQRWEPIVHTSGFSPED
jgi:tripartite-type tricarboxylate transporter receptor subunit TctC